MKKNMVVCASALLALLSSMTASAGVIYRWQDVTIDPDVGAQTGYIEFSYDAWRPGGTLSDDGVTGAPDSFLDPLIGVERLVWDNPSQVGFNRGLDLSLESCSENASCAAGFPDFEIFADWGGDFLSGSRVDVTFGALLTGRSLSFTNVEMGFVMHSTGALWTIDEMGTDFGGNCHTGCSGGTGLWVLDLSTLPPVRVPEPSSAVLMLIGLAAGVAYRKRQSM